MFSSIDLYVDNDNSDLRKQQRISIVHKERLKEATTPDVRYHSSVASMTTSFNKNRLLQKHFADDGPRTWNLHGNTNPEWQFVGVVLPQSIVVQELPPSPQLQKFLGSFPNRTGKFGTGNIVWGNSPRQDDQFYPFRRRGGNFRICRFVARGAKRQF